MKTLVIYDSAYGNTETLARAIGAATGAETRVASVSQVGAGDLQGVDLLVVGSPTQGGRPTKPMAQFLASIPAGSMEGARLAIFDTRVVPGNVLLRSVLKIVGFAAPRMAKALQPAGGQLMATEGFVVEDKEGPLRAGELERAGAWAQNLVR